MKTNPKIVSIKSKKDLNNKNATIIVKRKNKVISHIGNISPKSKKFLNLNKSINKQKLEKNIKSQKNITIPKKILSQSPTLSTSKNSSKERYKLKAIENNNYNTINKNKMTISTNLETISPENDKEKENQENQDDIQEELKDTIGDIINPIEPEKGILTPIPIFQKKSS